MTNSTVGPMWNRPAWYRLVAWAVLCVILPAMPGCARWIELSDRSYTEEKADTISIAADERVPVLLSTVRVSQNGTRVTTPPEFEQRVLNVLQDTNLFSQLFHVGYAQPAEGHKFLTARLSVQEAVDPHAGEAAWKGFLISASMFLLAPAIALEYEYGAEMTLELERWDGTTKHYRAASNGAAFYYLFGATPLAVEELKGKVTEACLTALVQQLVQNTNQFLAGSAPLPSNPSRIISVRAKRTPPQTVPVSTTTESSLQ